MSADNRVDASALSRVHLVTYGSGAFARSVELLAAEADRFGFSNIHAYGPATLPQEFVRAHRSFFLQSGGKGDGYWLWKSYIVLDLLSRLPDGAILFYVDAGCAINVGARARFFEWMDMCAANGVISFQMDHLEKHWTKMSVARFMNCDSPKYLDTGQIMGAILGVRKTPTTLELVRHWYEICCLEWTVDDSVQPLKNADGFREHRHDQSVLSLLLKQAGFASIPDETYPENGDWNNASIAHIPIVARRRGKKRAGVLSWFKSGTSLAQRARRG